MTRAFAAVRALALAGALAPGLGACGASPPKDRASELARVEDVMGTLFAEISMEGRFPYDDAALAAYVGGVGKRVADRARLSGRTWSFQVLDESEVNAFALLGGHAYITRGMLAILDSEAELAAVLAHEMAHVTAGHGIQTISDLAAGAARGDDPDEDGSARDKEYQADQLAIGYLAAAGYDPRAFGTMLRALYGWTPDEKRSPPRGPRLSRAALSAGQRSGELGRERYLEHIDGLVLGEDPRAGRVDDGRFIDEQSGFSIALPAAMTGEMEGRDLQATDATGKSALMLRPLGTRGSLFWDATLAGLRKTGPVEARAVPGGNALVGRNAEVWMALVTMDAGGRAGEHRHLLAATGPDLESGQAMLRAALASYRAVESRERQSPRRLRVLPAGREGPIAGLLDAACGGSDRVDRAASLRLHGPSAPRVLRAGEHVKCAPPR